VNRKTFLVIVLTTGIFANALTSTAQPQSAQVAQLVSMQTAPSNPELRRIQVGTFQQAANAERAFNILRNAGLSPVYESHVGGRRVVLPGVDVRHLSFILPMLNNAGFHNVWIREEIDRLYRIQVGAFREAANAEAALNTLRNAGLNPIYENHMGYRRVVLAGINTRHISPVLTIVYNSGFNDVWLREEPTISHFTIIVQGNAAVTEIQGTGSTAPLAIVHTIPSFGVAVTDRIHHANAPIVFFFNDRIYLYSIAPNVEVTANGIPIDGTIIINEAANGFAVLTFTPTSPLPADTKISIVMGHGLQNARGIQMLADVGLSFVTELDPETDFTGNYGFELGDMGVVFRGDAAINTARGPLVPFEGNYFAAMSTGTRLVSDGAALFGNTESLILIGPIHDPFFSLSFYYNFISAEFNEWVGSAFDDSAWIRIRGPRGVRLYLVASVNTVGFNNVPFVGFPGMPDAGDGYAGQTGWRNFHVENLDVGSPAFIEFFVTDLTDAIFSSILAIDAIDLGR